MNVRPLRTAADHAWALRQLEALWDRAKPGTPDGDRFDVLATLVDAWEREHVALQGPDPIEAIRFRMEQRGLTVRDLLGAFGTRARASEILGKKRRLTLGMIRALHAELEIPIDVLARAYRLSTGSSRRSPRAA